MMKSLYFESFYHTPPATLLLPGFPAFEGSNTLYLSEIGHDYLHPSPKYIENSDYLENTKKRNLVNNDNNLYNLPYPSSTSRDLTTGLQFPF